MANEDFYVEFGSNASVFAGKLRQETATIKGIVADLKRHIAEGDKAAQAAAQRLLAAGGAGGGWAMPAGGPPPSGGGGGRRVAGQGRGRGGSAPYGGGGASGGIDATALANVNRGLGLLVGNLDDVLSGTTKKIADTVLISKRTSETLRATADLFKSTVVELNKRLAQTNINPPDLTQKGTPRARAYFDPTNGRRLKVDEVNAGLHPNAQPVKTQREKAQEALLAEAAREKQIESLPPAPRIQDIPPAMIDEAQLSRLIEKTAQTAKNTQTTNSKLDLLIAAVNRGGTGQRQQQQGKDAAKKDDKDKKTYGPAEPKGPSPIRDDPFERVSQIRGHIKKTERLQALRKWQKEGDPGTAEGRGALGLGAFGVEQEYKGPAMKGRVAKAIASIESELKGVPRLTTLRKQLDEAIAATGTEDGRRRDAEGNVVYPERKKKAGKKAATKAAADAAAPTGKSAEDRQAALAERVKSLTAEKVQLEALLGQARTQEAMFQQFIDQRKANNAAGKKSPGLPTLKELGSSLERVQGARATLEAEHVKVEAAWEKAMKAEIGITKQDERKINQRVAKAKSKLALTGPEAREKMAVLDRAGDPSVMRGMKNDELFSMVEAYRQQGYEVPGVGKRTASGGLPRNAQKDRMIEGLRAANERYTSGEQGTIQGLEAHRKGKSEKISAAARKATEKIMKTIHDTVDEEATNTILADIQGGGSGTGAGRRGKVDQAFGSGTQMDGRPNDRANVQAMYARDAARRDAIMKQARASASEQIRKDPRGFNPYGEEFKVEGTTQAARDTRMAVAKMQKATQAFDAIAGEAIKYHKRLEDLTRAEQRLAQVQEKNAQFAAQTAGGGSRSKRDTHLYVKSLAEEKALQAQVSRGAGEKQHIEESLRRLYSGKGSQFAELSAGASFKQIFGDKGIEYGEFAKPGYSEGIKARAAGAARLKAEQEEQARLRAEAAAQRAALSAGADYRYGVSNAIGVGAGTVRTGQKSSTVKRTATERLLPDIRNPQAIHDEFGKAVNHEALKRAQKAERKLFKAEADRDDLISENLADKKAGKDPRHGADKIAAAQHAVAVAYSRLLTKIEEATGKTLPTKVSAADVLQAHQENAKRAKRGEEPLPVPLRDYTHDDRRKALAAQAEIEKQAQKAQAAKNKAAAESGANLYDPRSFLKKDASGKTLLERRADPLSGTPFAAPYQHVQRQFREPSAAERARIDASKEGQHMADLRRAAKEAEQKQADPAYWAARKAALLKRAESATNETAYAPGGILGHKDELTRRAGLSPEQVLAERRRRAAEREASLYRVETTPIVQPRGPGAGTTARLTRLDTAASDPLGRARGELEKAGVRMSDTMNKSLHQARTLPALIAALEAALKAGTLVISQYLGPQREAKPAFGVNRYMPGTGVGLPRPDDSILYRRNGGQELVPSRLGNPAAISAERFLENVRQRSILTPGGTHINPRDIGRDAVKAGKTPEVLGTMGADGVLKRAAAAAEADAKATTKAASAAGDLAKHLASAEKHISGGKDSAYTNLVRGKLAKAAGLEQGDYKEGGLGGLQRLVDVVKGRGAGGDGNIAAVKEAVAAGKKQGFSDDCCTKIVAAINQVRDTLKGVIRVTGGNAAGTTAQPQRGDSAPTAAPKTPRRSEQTEEQAEERRALAAAKAARRQAREERAAEREAVAAEAHSQRMEQRRKRTQQKADEALQREERLKDASQSQGNKRAAGFVPMSNEAMAAYQARIPRRIFDEARGTGVDRKFTTMADPTSGKQVANDAAVRLGTSMVVEGYASRSTAVDFLRQRLNLTAEAATNLDKRLKASIKAEEAGAQAQRGVDQNQRRQNLQAQKDSQQAKVKQKETAKADSTSRMEALELQKVLALMGKLSPAGREHLKNLQDAVKNGKSQEEILQRQLALYKQIGPELAKANQDQGKVGRTKDVATLMSHSMGTKVNPKEAAAIGADVEANMAKGLRSAAEAHQGSQGPLLQALFGGQGFMARSVHSIGTFLVRNFSAGLVFGVTNAMQDMISQALETEAAFIRISSALEATGRSSQGLRPALQQISTDYGIALKDVYTTAAGMTGIFKTNSGLEQATRVAGQLEIISRGALNSTEAMKSLASVTTAFGLQGADDLTHIADVLTVIQDSMGVNIEDVVEGTGRLAGQAAMLGFGMEETMSYVAAISKLTGQTGQAAGEQMSRIFSQLQTGRGQGALTKNLDKSTGIQEALSTRNYSDAVKILMENYGGLTKAQQDNIAVTLGGARQAAAINALLSQGTDVLDVSAKAMDAQGEAAKRAASISATLNNQLKKLQANFVNLTKAIVDTGILDFAYILLRVTNTLLGGLNRVLAVMNDMADSNPLTRFAKHAVFGLLGMVAALKLVGIGMRALKGVASSSLGQALVAQQAAPGATPAAATRNPFARLNPFAGAGTGYSETSPHQPPGANRLATRLGDAAAVRASRIQERGSQLGQRLQATAAPTMGGYLRADMGRTIERASNAAGRAVTPLNNFAAAMRGSATAATMAAAAASALMIALTAVVMEAFASKRFADDQQAAYESKSSGKSQEEQEAEDRYAGKQAELNKRNLKSLEGPGGMARALGRGSHNLFSVFTGGLFSDYKSEAEAVGDFTDTKTKSGKNTDKALHKTMQDAFKRNREALLSGSLGQLEAANRLSEAEMASLRDDIQNSDMSSEQKAAAQAHLDSIQASVAKSAAKISLRLKGLNSLDVVTASQIQAMSAMMNAFSSAGASGADFPELVKALVDDVGFAEGSTFEKLFKGASGPMSQLDRTKNNRDAVKASLDSMSAELSNENLDTERRDELTPLALAALGQYEQMIQSVLQQTVEGAQAISAELKAIGSYGFAADALNTALAEIDAEIERQKADPLAVARLQGQRRGIVKQQTDTRLEGVIIPEQEARSRGRNTAANASSEVREAKAVLDAYEASFKAGENGVTFKEVSDARVRYNNALKTEADAIQAVNASGLQLQIAQTLNAVTKANLEAALASDAVAFALQQFGNGSREYNDALAREAQAKETAHQAREAERAAGVQTQILAMSPGDAVALAQARLDEANTALGIAQRYGTSSTQYQTANQNLITAQRAMNDAVRASAASDANLAIAIAEAAGDRVGAAHKQAAEAERVYQVALAEAGGNKNAASVKDADAGRIRANANVRDTVFNDAVGTIDFQKEIGEISANTAIALLTELLRQTNLTEEQRRQLRLKIKGLQADIQNSLTSSGFNIPDQIKLPTAYEVRRSLGIDPYVKAGNDTLKSITQMRDQMAGTQMRSMTTTSPMQVAAPVTNNNNEITVNNTVSSPAMVEAVARRVVDLIAGQIGSGTRANQTSPSLVRY